MALTHGYNTLTTGLVYINNDQQAILSWRKHLKLLLWTRSSSDKAYIFPRLHDYKT